MTTDDAHDPVSHDPVNHWATEHYGLEEDPDTPPGDSRSVPGQGASSVTAGRPRAENAAPSRRRTGLIASGILSLVIIAGVGGVSVAAADEGGAGGRGDGPRDGGRGAVVQFDDGGGPAGEPGGGSR